MIGHWKNFDELESSLSMEELLALIESLRKKDMEDKKFLAAIQGVDLDSEEDTKFESDIADLKGYNAQQEGFGINEGLGHIQLEV